MTAALGASSVPRTAVAARHHDGGAPRAAHDVREGGTWTRAQTVKNSVIVLVSRGALALADRTPAPLLLLLGRCVGWLVALVPRHRRVAESNAARCFSPLEAGRVARASFVRAGENAALSLLLRRPTVRASNVVALPEPACATFARALARGTGVVFVSAHAGPFEFVAARIAELGRTAAIVVRESYDPRLDPLVDAHRHARGLQVIHRGAPGAAFRIVRALRSGTPVGFLPDLGGRVPSAPAEFMGDVVPFPIGPQVLALRLGAPIVIGTLARTSPTRIFEWNRKPLFELRVVAVDHDDTDNVGKLTQRVACALSHAILAAPDDWLWMAPQNRLPMGNEQS
jgi:KDO2-lipid IV(A) lauroyltransferase